MDKTEFSMNLIRPRQGAFITSDNLRLDFPKEYLRASDLFFSVILHLLKQNNFSLDQVRDSANKLERMLVNYCQNEVHYVSTKMEKFEYGIRITETDIAVSPYALVSCPLNNVQENAICITAIKEVAGYQAPLNDLLKSIFSNKAACNQVPLIEKIKLQKLRLVESTFTAMHRRYASRALTS